MDNWEDERLEREIASGTLRELHIELDNFSGEQRQRERLENLLANTEFQYRRLMNDCFLCYKPTIFKSVEGYSCCWSCLQGAYHEWYRDRHYGPVAERKTNKR